VPASVGIGSRRSVMPRPTVLPTKNVVGAIGRNALGDATGAAATGDEAGATVVATIGEAAGTWLGTATTTVGLGRGVGSRIALLPAEQAVMMAAAKLPISAVAKNLLRSPVRAFMSCPT